MAKLDGPVLIDLTDDANDGLNRAPNAISQPGHSGPSIPDIVKRKVCEIFFNICPSYLDRLSKSDGMEFLKEDALLDFLVTQIVEWNGLYPKTGHDRPQLAGMKRKDPGENSPLNTDIMHCSKCRGEPGTDLDGGLNNELRGGPPDAAPRM
jgi:hypothetical protein